jgi:hypothetical protein
MAITFKKDRAIFTDMAGGEEAESLLEWLQKYPKGKIDLSECTHMQPANLQVLMAAKRPLHARPKDRLLAAWIDTAIKSGK